MPTGPSRFNVIAIDQLQPMQVLEAIDSEVIIADRMARLIELWALRDPPAAAVYDVDTLEFDPLKIQAETNAYSETTLRDRVNQAARAVTLANATGTDLDAIASRYPGGMPRLEGESDDRYRRRITLSPNGLSPHGSAESYILWALTAVDELRDASATTVEGTGVIDVAILPDTASMIPTREQIVAVAAYIQSASRKGLTDVVNVRAPKVVPTIYDIDVWLYPGPDQSAIEEALRAGLDALIEKQRWLGYDHTHTAIQGVLSVGGVHHAVVKTPATDIVVPPWGVVRVDEVRLTFRGRTE
jgi:phage-related baseplate assembly protein